MLPNLSPSPNLYKVQSVYNNNVALHEEVRVIYVQLGYNMITTLTYICVALLHR